MLGERIRAARLAKGWKQRELAAATELNQSYISAVENGRVRDVATGQLLRFARALEVTPNELLNMNEGGLAGEPTRR